MHVGAIGLQSGRLRRNLDVFGHLADLQLRIHARNGVDRDLDVRAHVGLETCRAYSQAVNAGLDVFKGIVARSVGGRGVRSTDTPIFNHDLRAWDGALARVLHRATKTAVKHLCLSEGRDERNKTTKANYVEIFHWTLRTPARYGAD